MPKQKDKGKSKTAGKGKKGTANEAAAWKDSSTHASLLRRSWRFLTTRRGKLIAVVVVVLAPLGVIARTSLVTTLRPTFTKVVDGVSGGLGADPIQITDRHEYTGLTYAVNPKIAANDPSPIKGCFDEQWIKTNGGVPLFTEIYVTVSTPRSDVALVGASMKYDPRPSTAKSIVTCDEGGDGAHTAFTFKLYESKTLEHSVSGQGASEDGQHIFLPLVAGEEYPVAVTVQVGDPMVARWTSELLFQVGDSKELVKRSLETTETTGVPSAIPSFVSQEGRWTPAG
jgi:hypothetical protein